MPYESPRITELGSLSELTQNLLPSLRAMDGTLAAISAPATPPNTPPASVTQSAPSQEAAPVAPVAQGAPSGEVVPAPTGGGVQGEQETGPVPGGGEGAGPTPVEGGGEAPVAAAPRGTSAGGGEEGDLPFTGFPALVVGAVGAVTAGAGAALRRASRRR